MEDKNHVMKWYEANRDTFNPPVCNKLMHKKQLSIMFVGGPNTRTDFHLEEGSEFFYQLKGNMELPTIQQGKRKLVRIREGEVFLLPSRVPHSPQRPEGGSLGLVIERERDEETEVDGLRWYTDFEKCEEILYEKFFYCGDLGRDLVPVVKAFKESEEFKTMKPGSNVCADPPLKQDFETSVPDPFSLQEWLKNHDNDLAAGRSVNLFEGHPDREFSVMVHGGASEQAPPAWPHETFFMQLKGDVAISVGVDPAVTLAEGECCVVGANKSFKVVRPAGSIGLVITQDPQGNKK